MTVLTKEKVSVFQRDMNEAMKKVAEQHGFSISQGNMTFYSEDGIVKLRESKFSLKATNGDIPVEYTVDLKRHGWIYNLTSKHVGKKITGRTGQEEFIGLKGNKYAITRSADNKMWKKDPYVVAQLLGAMTAEQAALNKAALS